MAKKCFIPKATLVKSNWRWYFKIEQIDPSTNEIVTIRKTFNLNRLKNLQERNSIATELGKKLNRELLPSGYPFEKVITKENFSLLDGIQFALSIKLNLPRKNSHKSYRSNAKIFLSWCKRKNLDKIALQDFGARQAIEFMDFIGFEKKVAARTYNNCLIHMKALWNELIKREYIEKNPWLKIEQRKVFGKNRRALNEDEKKEILKYTYENHRWLFYAIILQYWCLIRPGELARLKFKDFDFKNGIITINEAVSKNWKTRNSTIPKSILKYFKDPFFYDHPVNHFIFGENLKPGPKLISPNCMNKLHKRIIKILYTQGKIKEPENIKFYSWKDSGVTKWAQYLTPIELKELGGWSSINMALRYYHQSPINEGARNLPNDLL